MSIDKIVKKIDEHIESKTNHIDYVNYLENIITKGIILIIGLGITVLILIETNLFAMQIITNQNNQIEILKNEN